MKKLKDILNESQHLSYKRMNVGEDKEKEGMTNEEKREFLKAVSEYKRFGESIYRSGNLGEIYESIKGIVETAHKVTLEETGDWFDKVTVGRHMKSMNESFKVFEKTISEVNTLQQRLESAYDEMGEVLGKYYEIKEGNEFGAERAKAIAKGKDEFEVDGKKFPVTDVDKEDKENAKDFAKESVVNEGKHDAILDKLADIVKGAKSFMDIGKELKSNGIKYSFGTNMIPMYIIDKPVKIAILNNKYADGAERVVGDTAIGLMESIKEEKSMKLTDILSENKYSIIDPKGNQKGVGPKDAANKRAKALGGAKKGYFVVPAKSALKARRAMEKYKFDFKNAKLQDMMSDLYFEGVEESVNEDTKKRFEVDFYNNDRGRTPAIEEIIRGDKFSDVVSQAIKIAKSKGMVYVEFYYKDAFIGSIDKRNGYEFKKGRSYQKSPLSVNEGASTEEKRIVMMAIKKIAKYRNVPLDYAVGDVMRAAEELERDIKKGKVKK